jgi:hypothetical protein
MHKLTPVRLVVAGLAVATLALAPQALAFGTIRSFGQNAEHERITRKAMEGAGFGGATLDLLAGKNGTFGAVGAPDRPGRDLITVSQAHCDDGDWFNKSGYAQSLTQANDALRACRTLMYQNLDQALAHAGDLVRPDLSYGDTTTGSDCPFDGKKGSPKCRVLEYFGLALHASQDFYSHSNWVDAPRARPTVEDPQGLNNNGPADWLGPAQPQAVPAGLITGCYGFPEWANCGGRVKHAYLNKDTASTSRGGYDKAMRVAAEDTRAKWDQFSANVRKRYGDARGNKILCVIRSDRPRESCG